jgi:hypothetical protein
MFPFAAVEHLPFRKGTCGALSLLLIGWGLRPTGLAGQTTAKSGNEQRDLIVAIAREYRLFLGADRRALTLQAEPVLRWPNATRGTTDGATFVWTRDGRPEAIACIWKDPVLSHAFHSLSMSSLVAEYGGRIVWHPQGSGIRLEDLAERLPPADSAVARLRQMKEIARRFHCRLSGNGPEDQALRLLPSAIYRYDSDRANVLDGALFAYVQGTDPEVILLVEAHRQNGQARWKYALTRRSCCGLEADLDGRRIWSVAQSVGAPGDVWFHGDVSR